MQIYYTRQDECVIGAVKIVCDKCGARDFKDEGSEFRLVWKSVDGLDLCAGCYAIIPTRNLDVVIRVENGVVEPVNVPDGVELKVIDYDTENELYVGPDVQYYTHYLKGSHYEGEPEHPNYSPSTWPDKPEQGISREKVREWRDKLNYICDTASGYSYRGHHFDYIKPFRVLEIAGEMTAALGEGEDEKE